MALATELWLGGDVGEKKIEREPCQVNQNVPIYPKCKKKLI